MDQITLLNISNNRDIHHQSGCWTVCLVLMFAHLKKEQPKESAGNCNDIVSVLHKQQSAAKAERALLHLSSV